MANTKISQLPSYTGTTADLRWFVMNNSGETETFKFSGYSSPVKYQFSQFSYQDAWDNTPRVASDYQVVIGGGNGSDIDATSAPYCSIFGSTNCQITTKHNGKGYGTVIVGSSASVIGGASDSTANFGPGIYTTSTGENNGFFTSLIGTFTSKIRYGADNNNGIQYSIIAGGNTNTLSGLALESAILGGKSNVVQQYRSAIIVGENNNILDSGTSLPVTTYRHSTIVGGENNTITQSRNSSIIGGTGNTMTQENNTVMLGCVNRTASTDTATFVENLVIFNYSNLDYVDDTAASAGGVVLGQVYHNAGALRIRIV